MKFAAKIHLIEAAVAGVVAGSIILAWVIYDKLDAIQSNLVDTNDYFIVNNVHVADAKEGGNPKVIYDRLVVRDFRGQWIASVRRVAEREGDPAYGVCNNSQPVDYKKSTVLPKTGVDLEWYIEKDCKLKPGRYFLKTIWEIFLPGQVIKRVRYSSNIFTIHPK